MNTSRTAQPSPLDAADFEIIGLARDWCDVRLELPFQDARTLLVDSLPRRGLVDEAGNVIRRGEGEAEGKELLTLKDWQPLGRLGYKFGCEIVGPPTTGSIRLMGGHPKAMRWSMFSASQQCSSFIWEMIEKARPRNWTGIAPPQVNRVDYAVDFFFPVERQEELFRAAGEIAGWAGIPTYREGKPGKGETFWLNWSKQAEFEKKTNPSLPIHSARLYQKGYEQGAALMIPGAPSLDLWRYEHVYRPDKDISKEQGFRIGHDDVFMSKKWSRAFLDMIGYTGGITEGLVGTWPQQVDLADEKARRAKAMRTLGHMTDQYAKAAQELAGLVGWDAVIESIAAALKVERTEEDPTKPGDALRREANKLWCERIPDRYKRPERPVFMGDDWIVH